MPKCSDLMQAPGEVCVPHERLLDALEIMGVYDVGWVPVVESRNDLRLLGIVTARGAARFLGIYDRRPSEAMCREVMGAVEMSVAPGDDMELARQLMQASRFHRLPVIGDGRLVGIIRLHDIEVYGRK